MLDTIYEMSAQMGRQLGILVTKRELFTKLGYINGDVTSLYINGTLGQDNSVSCVSYLGRTYEGRLYDTRTTRFGHLRLYTIERGSSNVTHLRNALLSSRVSGGTLVKIMMTIGCGTLRKHVRVALEYEGVNSSSFRGLLGVCARFYKGSQHVGTESTSGILGLPNGPFQLYT